MGAMAGFILGYIVGMKQGPEGYAKLRQALDDVLGSPDAKALLERVPFLSGNLTGGGAGHNGSPGLDLGAAVRAVAESDALQALVAGGLDLARGLLERVTTGTRAVQSGR
jgi:hypothetical protein